MKLALALIVKATDKESEYLGRALKYTAPYVDGIFITITGENKKIEDLCKLYNANISHYEWDYSFANARNYNFSQVPKEYEYILWMDSDDIFRGLENLKPTIEKNLDCDGFIVNYLYAFDKNKKPVVVHLKTQVVKNDGCVEWAGDLHEDFKENRKVIMKVIKGIERLHLSDEQRFDENKERNLEISKKMMEKLPNDPRCYWNLANSQRACGLYTEAIETFDKFLGMSKSEDEKYIALVSMAEIYFIAGDYQKALDTCKIAIGTKPEYPNAYFLKGHIYFELKNWIESRDAYVFGLKLKPPVFKIIVYNPRDYDYHPLKQLAKVYINLNLPSIAYELLEKILEIEPDDEEVKDWLKVMKKEKTKFNKVLKEVERISSIKDKEKLKIEIDNLSPEIASHPIICQIRNLNFIKQCSTGKDLVFYCGMTAEEWNPKIVKEKGIGGSEEAIINLSKGLVLKGYNVTVYNSCGYKEEVFDGVHYKPFWMWNYRDKQDITVIWRHPKPLDYDINCEKIYVDLHDVIPESEFTENRLEKITKIFVKSQAQRELFPGIKDEKFKIIPNGVDVSLFNQTVERDFYYILNLSSPDRSLSSCLSILVDVRKRVSREIRDKIKFKWYYGWQVFDASRVLPEEQEWAKGVKDEFERCKREGWVEGGYRINHQQVAIENLKAGVLLYPSQFYEIDWIGGTKAQIAGCIPITSNFAAIGEKIKFGVKIDVSKLAPKEGPDFGVTDPKVREMFINALVDYFNNIDEHRKQVKEMQQWAIDKYNIGRIIDEWDGEFKINQLIKPTCQILTS